MKTATAPVSLTTALRTPTGTPVISLIIGSFGGRGYKSKSLTHFNGNNKKRFVNSTPEVLKIHAAR